MTSLQETITLPQWVVDDTEDFLTVLQNNSTVEKQSQMTYSEKNIPGMQISPFNNKEKANFDQSNSEIDQILSNMTQQDHQIREKPDQQLSESERIDRMNENQVIDYLVDLMWEEPSDPKTKPYQPSDKGNNECDYIDSCSSQRGKLESNLVQNTMQCTEIDDLSDIKIVQAGILENSLFQNTSQFTGVEQLPNINLVQIDAPENGNFQHTMLYGDVKQLPDASLKTCEISSKSEILNPISSNDIMGDIISTFHHPGQYSQTNQNNQNNQNNKDTMNQSPHQNEITEKKIYQRSINQDFNNDGHTKVDIKSTQNKLNNKIIYIQNAASTNKHKYIINKNINHVQAVPVEKRVTTIDTKKLIEIVQAQNKAFAIKKGKLLDKGTHIQQKSTQNQIKMPTLNKERELSTKSQTFNMSSRVVEVELDIEKINSEITSTKKRKRYEEESKGDEEEEKKIFQAKKAKNYREKKKEEFKMKDIQIQNLQEALRKSEKEKKAYMNENNQLKEDLKKKVLLLELYEVN